MRLKPITECQYCGGKVIYTTNDVIYGKKYGSGYCYLCTSCRAFVGTHKPRPEEPLGTLADEETRKLRRICHDEFDLYWTTRKERDQNYRILADALDIPLEECHFAMMDKKRLRRAIKILVTEKSLIFQQ